MSYKWDNKKRVTIGILIEDDPNMMYPGPNYFKFFGTESEQKVPKLKEHFGGEQRKQAGKVDSRISVGTYFA